MSKCIKVGALFKLVSLIQKDIEAEQGGSYSISIP